MALEQQLQAAEHDTNLQLQEKHQELSIKHVNCLHKLLVRQTGEKLPVKVRVYIEVEQLHT